jgi:hypothetical protein
MNKFLLTFGTVIFVAATIFILNIISMNRVIAKGISSDAVNIENEHLYCEGRMGEQPYLLLQTRNDDTIRLDVPCEEFNKIMVGETLNYMTWK